jgi:hypothetical protein
VPPVTITVIDPSLAKHVGAVVNKLPFVIPIGGMLSTKTDWVFVQPIELVISTVYKPCVSPVTVVPVCPFTFDNQLIVKALVGFVSPVINIFPDPSPGTQLASSTT